MPTATQDFSAPRTTTRAVIDHSRQCPARCAHCYYRPKDQFYGADPWKAVEMSVMAAVERGCDCVEVTGGEPLAAPWIVDLVKLCNEVNLPPRIISSLVCDERVLDAVLDAGVDDWLLSLHGTTDETRTAVVLAGKDELGSEPTHKGEKVGVLQRRRMAKIAARMDYCVNYTLLEQNQAEIADFARWMVDSGHRPPKVVNYINFNVFGDWLITPEWIAEGKRNVIDPRIAGPLLDEAIDILEAAGIGVNLRYAPMCMVAERHRKNICNDYHVAFDFGEWDNSFGARTPPEQVFKKYSLPLSSRNEEQGEPCSNCGIKAMCGGAGRIWHQLALEKFGTEVLTPQPAPADVTEPAYWHYRQHNVLGLDPRR